MTRALKGFLGLVLIVAVGCRGAAGPEQKGPATKAIAVLHPTAGNNVRGVVAFDKVKEGVRVVAYLEGLTPGLHGFHVHEYGDCSSPDATSAGGHFDPKKMPHGGPDMEKRHIGDLGNIEADSSGIARFERVDPLMTLEGPESVVGHALIVHVDPDDYKTQPTGGSGARLACGVIGFAK